VLELAGNIKRKSGTAQRSGNQEGAGRPAGSVKRAVAEQKRRLSKIARIATACAILDRGLGKPRGVKLSKYSEPEPFDSVSIW